MTLERNWIDWLQMQWPQVDLRQDTFFDSATRQILTTDMLVEGVHFSWEYFQPEDVGWRSVAVNLSDIAATGGTPTWILVSVGVPSRSSLTLLKGIYKGIADCCREYNCTLVGGDTVRASQATISVTAVGQLPKPYLPGRRNMAKPGHFVAVSGVHGLSRAGLEALQKELDGFDTAKRAHIKPIPLIRLGQRISHVLPSFAMMDSSDGLADAIIRLAEASRVDIVIDSSRLPVHPEVEQIATAAKANPMDWVLYGGEDFQLVVTLPQEALAIFPELHPIGYVQAASVPNQGQGFLQEGNDRILLDSEKAFQHFSELASPSCPLTQEGVYS